MPSEPRHTLGRAGPLRWLATAFCVSLVATPAFADERSEARRHFEAGMELIAASKFERGVAELEEAYVILPHPAVLYNIGRAWRDAGELGKALDAFQRYLGNDPEDREEVEAAIANLEDRIAEAGGGSVTPPPPEPGEPDPSATLTQPADVERPDRADDATKGEGLYEEQVVTASKVSQSPLDAPMSTTIVTRQDIRLSGITRIPELLRRVAGMDVMQITGGDANVSMRGLNSRLSNKILVLVDSRVVKNEVLGSTFWETLSIDVDQIERIEIVRGPGSSLYGADALSGVINIITVAPGEGDTGFRAGFGDGPQGYGSVWVSRREGDFAYRASAGYTRYPRWTREVAPDRVDVGIADVDQNLGAQNVRLDMRSSYRVDPDKELFIGGGFSRSEIELYGIGPFNDYLAQIDSSEVTAGFVADWIDIRASYTNLSAFASQNHDYTGHTLYETDPIQHKLFANLALNHDASFPEGLGHSLLGGVNYQLKSIDWSYLIDEPPIEHHVGVFAQDALSFAEHYSVVLSGRLDYVPVLGTVIPSGRGTFLVRPGTTKRQAIRASVATAFRTPTFLESYLDIPIQLSLAGVELQSSSERLDDPDFRLGAENIVSGELGYLNKLSDDFEAEVAVYYHRISDFIVLAEPRQLTLSNVDDGLGGINPQTGRYNVGFGGWTNQCAVDHVFGGEIGGRYYGLEGLDVFANYALNYDLQQLPTGCVVADDQRTSRHKFNVGTQLRTGFGLEGEITFHYQTSQLWGEQVATLDGVELQLFELPDYHLLNGRLGFSFLDRKRATVGATVYNALGDVLGAPAQQHPFGNRVGRRFMGTFAYRL
jgi:outer membrane receptor for ferrienterochelin and colicin